MSVMACKFSVSLILVFVSVEATANDTIFLRRYNPCGLGITQFDLIRDTFWRAVIHLEKYVNSSDVEINMSYENPVTVYTAMNNVSMSAASNKRNYSIFICGEYGIPDRYTFYLNTEKQSKNVPGLSELKINKQIVCTTTTAKTLHDSDILDVSNHNHQCGRKSYNYSEYFKIGGETELGEWPWMAAVFMKENKVLTYRITAVIISRNTVLSTGFFEPNTVNASDLVITAGVTNYNFNNSSKQTQVVQRIISHPNYVKNNAASHLVLYLVQGWIFNSFVQPICLWGPMIDQSDITGKNITMLGFTNRNRSSGSTSLRSTFVKVSDTAPCAGYDASYHNEFTICTDLKSNKDNNSDFGSMLVVPVLQTDGKVSWYVRAVLSVCFTKENSCNNLKNAIFTDISTSYFWITNHYHH